MKRQSRKASLMLCKLGLERPGLPVQFPPGGVDYRLFGPRNHFRAIFIKCINGKVFHHVAEEIFLGPSAEEARRVLRAQLAVSRADQARLMPAGGQLAKLTDPQALLAAADPRTHLRQFYRHDLATRHRA